MIFSIQFVSIYLNNTFGYLRLSRHLVKCSNPKNPKAVGSNTSPVNLQKMIKNIHFKLICSFLVSRSPTIVRVIFQKIHGFLQVLMQKSDKNQVLLVLTMIVDSRIGYIFKSAAFCELAFLTFSLFKTNEESSKLFIWRCFFSNSFLGMEMHGRWFIELCYLSMEQ